jgi:hypothetical protein
MAYEVVDVKPDPRQWENKHNNQPMLSWRIDIRDAAGTVHQNVELPQRASSPAPTVGQALDGNLDNTQYGLRFKKAFTPGAGGGAPRGKTPQESAAIQRMHLQKTAPDWAEFLLTLGVVKQPVDDREAFNLMTRVMDWLARDIERAKGSVS